MSAYSWPQEVARVVLVELVSSLEGVAVGGYEWQRVLSPCMCTR
jgi:hypothetical protein